MKFISQHTAQLAKQMYDGLSSMKHGNGVPLAIIYKDENAVYGDPSTQGATLAFNVRRSDGVMVGYEDVEQAADDRSIFLRSGSLCNPGGLATYLNWSPPEMRAAYAAGHRCSNPTQVVLGKPTGVVRVSLGAMSTAGDVLAFLHFISEVYCEGDAKHQVADINVQMPTADLVPKAKLFNIPSAASSPTTPQFPMQKPPPQMPFLDPMNGNTYARPGLQARQKSNNNEDAASWNGPPTAFDTSRPAFIQQDYMPSRLRRNYTTSNRKSYAPNGGMEISTGMEIKVREFHNESPTVAMTPMTPRTQQTPSVKSGRSKRFGRSVVNLLHRKGSHPDEMPQMAYQQAV